MEKYIKDNKTAILYSPGFGAGWSTWSSDIKEKEHMIFSPVLVQAVLRKADYGDVLNIAEELFPNEYLGGIRDLTIKWLPVGTPFYITDYDGSESVVTENKLVYEA